MKTVSIVDDTEYLNEAVAEGMWSPCCPKCEAPYGPVELDFTQKVECEACQTQFKVEGI